MGTQEIYTIAKMVGKVATWAYSPSLRSVSVTYAPGVALHRARDLGGYLVNQRPISVRVDLIKEQA